FRVTFTANEESFLHGYLTGKAGYKKAMLMAPNFNAGQSAVENMEKGFTAAGGTVVQKLMPRLGNPDYGSFIGQISPDADVGLVLMIGGDAIRFIKAYADFGGKLPLWGPSSTVDETILPAQGKAALGFVGIAFYVSTLDTPENKAFIQEWKGAYQGLPAWFGAAGYATGQILGEALQRVGGNTTDKEALLKAIKDTRLTTPAGPFRFDANNDPVQPRYVMQIREVGGAVQPVILGALPEYAPGGGPPQIPADLKLPK